MWTGGYTVFELQSPSYALYFKKKILSACIVNSETVRSTSQNQEDKHLTAISITLLSLKIQWALGRGPEIPWL